VRRAVLAEVVAVRVLLGRQTQQGLAVLVVRVMSS